MAASTWSPNVRGLSIWRRLGRRIDVSQHQLWESICASSVFSCTNPATERQRRPRWPRWAKLVEQGMKAGWLLATEGVSFGATGIRVPQERGREGRGHRRPVRRGQGGPWRLCTAQSRVEGRSRRVHAGVPRGRRPRDLRDLPALRTTRRRLRSVRDGLGPFGGQPQGDCARDPRSRQRSLGRFSRVPMFDGVPTAAV